MSIEIITQTSASVKLPPTGRVSMFIDNQTNRFGIKKPTGNISYAMGIGQEIITEAFNVTNDSITNLQAGSMYLPEGVLSVSSSMLFGTQNGTGETMVELYKESNGSVLATWTLTTGQIQNVVLGTTASIAAPDWYTVRFRLSFGSDTSILRGMRLVFE